MNFNWVDFIIMALIFHGVARGLRKGLSGEIIAIIGFIAAAALSFHFYRIAALKLEEVLPVSYPVSGLLAFSAIAAAVVSLSIIIQKTVHNAVELSFMSFFERFGGALLGGLRRVIVIGLILFICGMVYIFSGLPKDLVQTGKDSILARSIYKLLPRIYDVCTMVYPKSKNFSGDIFLSDLKDKYSADVSVTEEESEKDEN